MRVVIIFIAIVVVFSGCTPLYNYNNRTPNFALYDLNNSLPDKNDVIFSGFDIPQPVTRSESMRVPVRFVHLFDVTDQIEYIGTFPSGPFEGAYFDVGFGTFFEYNSPLGLRTFMLVLANTSLFAPSDLEKYHTDFIQVNVSKKNLTHISIAYRYQGLGLMSHSNHNLITGGGLLPFFTQIDVDDKYFQSCEKITGDRDSRINQINEYITNQSINPNQKFFKNYCGMLASRFRTVLTSNENGYMEFEKNKAIFVMLKEKRLPEWKKTTNRNMIFPLIQPNLNK